MSALPEPLRLRLTKHATRWCVTGAAGFIGSHLVETLLLLGQNVTGLDNLSTGKTANLDAVRAAVGDEAYARFTFLRGDITHADDCRRAVSGSRHVLHHAAQSSVSQSLADPSGCDAVNVTGCLNMLEAARGAGVSTFVYASSSAVYGDDPALPKTETQRGEPLSPYAASKAADELYAAAYARAYGLRTVGLRYFNIYGPRQDPAGAYAAVIPLWIDALARGQAPTIFGDGLSTRDYCFVSDVARANILAAIGGEAFPGGQVCNIGGGRAVTLLELAAAIRVAAKGLTPRAARLEPVFAPPRPGDIRHSLADIGKARQLLGFAPGVSLARGLQLTVAWYAANTGRARVASPGPDDGLPDRDPAPGGPAKNTERILQKNCVA